MSEVLMPPDTKNPIKERLLTLIQFLRAIDVNGIQKIGDFPQEILQQIQELEALKIDFSGLGDIDGEACLRALEEEYKIAFNGAEDDLREVISVLPQQVTQTLTLSPEAQEKKQALQKWIEDNNSYLVIGKIKENVSVHNDGLHIQTTLGVKTLGWKGHTIGGVNTLGDNLAQQKYTIEELGAIIEALGGKELKLQDGYKIGGPEISKFLSEIAGLELDRFYWSSSEHVEVETLAWGLNVSTLGVYVYGVHRNSDNSSLASQN